MLRRTVVWAAVLAPLAGAAAGEGGLAVRLSATLGGFFRPGCPLLLRAVVVNQGGAVEGVLDVAVEAVTYRQPVRLGAGATTAVPVLVAAQSGAAQALVVLRSRGKVLYEGSADLGLRDHGGAPLVVEVGGDGAAARRLADQGATVVAAGEDLPTLAAGYSVADAVVVAGDGGGLPTGASSALADWVRGGGLIVFALPAGAAVRTESLLAGLCECSGRATPREWLGDLASRKGVRRVGGGLAWRAGVGLVVAGEADALDGRAVMKLLPPGSSGYAWADSEVYSSFGSAAWATRARWRLLAGAMALLAAGLLMALLVPRRWRRGAVVAFVLAASAALGAVAWAVMLPPGRGVLVERGVTTCLAGASDGVRTVLAGVGGVGQGRVRLDFGKAEAVVPLYYMASDAGRWRDVVVERDTSGRVTVGCEVAKDVWRCFGAWWAWGSLGRRAQEVAPGDILVRDGQFAVAAASGPPEAADWRPLRELDRWGKGERALLEWQVRRVVADGRVYRAAFDEGGQAIGGQGLLEARGRPVLWWTKVSEEP